MFGDEVALSRVAVFDSGVGGLSILSSIVSAGLFKEVFYYGDTARVPYGVKDRDTIVRFSLEGLDFLLSLNPQLIVIACNTVSTVAMKEMKLRSPVPIVGVIEAGIHSFVSKCEDFGAKVLVLGTKATISSRCYQDALQSLGYKDIRAIATSLFVPIVEEMIYEGEVLESCFRHYFSGIEKPDVVLLGCTHFPLILPAFKRYFGESCSFIHPGESIVDYILSNFGTGTPATCRTKSEVSYYASGDVGNIRRIASEWNIS